MGLQYGRRAASKCVKERYVWVEGGLPLEVEDTAGRHPDRLGLR